MRRSNLPGFNPQPPNGYAVTVQQLFTAFLLKTKKHFKTFLVFKKVWMTRGNFLPFHETSAKVSLGEILTKPISEIGSLTLGPISGLLFKSTQYIVFDAM